MDLEKQTNAERNQTNAANDNGAAPDSEEKIDPRILTIAGLLGRAAAQECFAEAANDNEGDD